MSAPIKNTCPDIDRIIKAIKDALRNAKEAREKLHPVNDEEIDTLCWNVIYNLDGLESDLESLRDDNEKLRDWGHNLYDDLQKAAEQISELEDTITVLQHNN